ncbi:glycoside hydrolase family 3 C-terminal domain-containing protein [Rathayibacter sp. ZW T2_19]|uniref:Glycoside hydrolase family 3 C-terminal domain-containing protein n=1 Tax=Rathayibacter rubneri TaxID=2950106 RepID=A0A9X2E0R4_9MICO|nr:glycoside hydrolase family 3 C-terminal domain-containing protein [Rathayibacter rubneri]MCM6763776.1 glycoside hydrolase family 3 C-terminal domain-containing protein [Rathayibacter rubneri]
MTDTTTASLLSAEGPDADARLTELIGRLDLEEKVQLLTGRDFWTTWPIERIGLRRMLVSDGPSGVRGEVWDERSPSLNLPSATALSSSWDRSIAKRYGAAAAVEARRKDVDVVLGPTINLHRSPLGGRHFEGFSEDPVLTADLAAAYVSGVQENGVGATPKHYIANDSETDRFTVDVRVGDRALRELYLLAFERAIVETRAWLVMSSYNSINGTTATENDLLETPLNSEWGFDGVVISDWTAVRSVESARAAQDLVMPGPDGPWGAALVAAVRDGSIEESVIDRKVRRILRLAARVGALEGFAPAVSEPVLVEDGRAFAREAAAAGSVLLRNTGELPWDASALSSVAVIGHNARDARTQGGGSATVLPEKVVTPLDGIRAALPGARVDYALGAIVQDGVAPLALETITNPVTGEPGQRVRFLDAEGTELFVEDRRATALVWFGGTAPIAASARVEFSTVLTPEADATVRLGFAVVGTARIFVDGDLFLEETLAPVGADLGAALLAPPSVSGPLQVTAGTPVDIRIEYDIEHTDGELEGALGFTYGIEPEDTPAEQLIEEAVALARDADVALVVVGTNSAVESEGYDRSSLDLPGQQDALVRAVAAANPRTVVVVNSGSPVLLPWRDEVAAVLVGYFGGQEMGDAVADVLLGAVEPGGRLPTTWPAAIEDVPVLSTLPTDGELHYDEGIHIGYRAWLRSEVEPAYGFGHGLGYTSFDLVSLAPVEPVRAGEDAVLLVDVVNTGDRAGKVVLQAYAERRDSAVDRPVRWLVGFESASIEAGAAAQIAVTVPTRLLATWNDGWDYEAGAFTIRVGTSLEDVPLATELELLV